MCSYKYVNNEESNYCCVQVHCPEHNVSRMMETQVCVFSNEQSSNPSLCDMRHVNTTQLHCTCDLHWSPQCQLQPNLR